MYTYDHRCREMKSESVHLYNPVSSPHSSPAEGQWPGSPRCHSDRGNTIMQTDIPHKFEICLRGVPFQQLSKIRLVKHPNSNLILNLELASTISFQNEKF